MAILSWSLWFSVEKVWIITPFSLQSQGKEMMVKCQCRHTEDYYLDHKSGLPLRTSSAQQLQTGKDPSICPRLGSISALSAGDFCRSPLTHDIKEGIYDWGDLWLYPCLGPFLQFISLILQVTPDFESISDASLLPGSRYCDGWVGALAGPWVSELHNLGQILEGLYR